MYSFLHSDEGKTKRGNLVVQTQFYQNPFLLLQTLNTLSFSIFIVFIYYIQISKDNNLSFPSVSEAKQTSDGMTFLIQMLACCCSAFVVFTHVIPCYYMCDGKLAKLFFPTDIKERFTNHVLLLIVCLRNMEQFSWKPGNSFFFVKLQVQSQN